MRLPAVHRVNGRKLGRMSSGSPMITAHTGKGGGQAQLPNRAAVHDLLKMAPGSSALGNYSKMTPGLGTPSFNPPGAMPADDV